MLKNEVKNVILKSLDLEENEEFGIVGSRLKHRINENGLKYYHSGTWFRSEKLDNLLLGKLEIIKLPFVPKKNEIYFYPVICNTMLYEETYNAEWEQDKHRIEHKLTFRTKEGAIAKAKELLI